MTKPDGDPVESVSTPLAATRVVLDTHVNQAVAIQQVPALAVNCHDTVVRMQVYASEFHHDLLTAKV